MKVPRPPVLPLVAALACLWSATSCSQIRIGPVPGTRDAGFGPPRAYRPPPRPQAPALPDEGMPSRGARADRQADHPPHPTPAVTKPAREPLFRLPWSKAKKDEPTADQPDGSEPGFDSRWKSPYFGR